MEVSTGRQVAKMNWRQLWQCHFGRCHTMSDRVREAKPCPTKRKGKKLRSLMGRSSKDPFRPKSGLSWCGIDFNAIRQTTSGNIEKRKCDLNTTADAVPVTSTNGTQLSCKSLNHNTIRRTPSLAYNVACNGTINCKEAKGGEFQSRLYIAAVQVP